MPDAYFEDNHHLDEEGGRYYGEILGRDVVQMHDLAPGDYLLVARLSPAGETVRARPAVVGLEKPPPGPPEDVVRRYLAMEGRGR